MRTSATPGTASKRLRTTQSAVVFSAAPLALSDASAMNMISPITDAAGAICGGGSPAGSALRTVCSFSETICRADGIPVPQSNSTVTTDRPTLEIDRTRRTPGAPFKAVSIGKVTRLSTSTGDMPCASVTTVTDGAVRSGNTSTSMRVAS